MGQPVSPPAVLVGAGDIGDCNRPGRHQTAALLDRIDGTIFTLGDNAYSDGTTEDFAECFHPAWGRHKDRIYPSPGNHDYHTPGAAAYFAYFGANAGEPDRGFYSYTLGEWHVVALNSEISMAPGSPQEQWLRQDLAAHQSVCTVAYWHKPRFSSGRHGNQMKTRHIWEALYEHHVEIVLNGHEHVYERFAPQTPDGGPDPQRGIRQFTVGTGGRDLTVFVTELPNSEVRHDQTQGVLKLSLYPGSYRWEFVPVAGGTFTDFGSGSCHDAQPLPNNPPFASAGGPYAAEQTVTFDGRSSEDPDHNTALTYEWDFGDGSRGSGAAPTHSYRSDGTYVVTLTVRDESGASSTPDTTTVTIGNQSPTVDLGQNITANPGTEVAIRISFGDPATEDGPWNYSVDWGDGTRMAGRSATQRPIDIGHVFTSVGQYQLRVAVTDRDGGTGEDTLQISVVESGAVLVGAGNIARCSRNRDEATARLLDAIPGTVFTLGDNVHESGTAEEYRDCYDQGWGRHKARTRPSLGNSDYVTPAATPYFEYFGDAAGDPDKGYYSYDLGSWHIVVLNSRIGKGAGSVQERWLRADLAANARKCTLAYWHDALYFSTGSGRSETVKPFWDALYEAGAEVVLNSERRFYERFAPQTPGGEADSLFGIRQFVVGTGGWGTSSFDKAWPNSEVRHSGTYGVLKLTLHEDTYEWEFIPIASQSFTDSGSGTCHDPPGN